MLGTWHRMIPPHPPSQRKCHTDETSDRILWPPGRAGCRSLHPNKPNASSQTAASKAWAKAQSLSRPSSCPNVLPDDTAQQPRDLHHESLKDTLERENKQHRPPSRLHQEALPPPSSRNLTLPRDATLSSGTAFRRVKGKESTPAEPVAMPRVERRPRADGPGAPQGRGRGCCQQTTPWRPLHDH